MTKLMEKALEALNRLPEDKQEEIAQLILSASAEPVELTDAEREAVEEGRADAAAGRFATEEEYLAILARLRSA